jgi:hypothetical protein
MPEYLLAAEEARRDGTARDECFRNSNSIKKSAEPYCSFGDQASAASPSIVLWGDSLANQYLEPISSAAVANRLSGLIATQSGCRAFVDDDNHSREQSPCREFNRTTLEFLVDRKAPRIVLLGGNWQNAIELSTLIEKLLGEDKIVILILPLLNVGFDVPERWMEDQARVGRAINEWTVTADASMLMTGMRAEIGSIREKFRDDGRLVVADPLPLVCDGNVCRLVTNGQSNFRDSVHISSVTAHQYEAMFDAAFKRALLEAKSTSH